MKYKKLLIPDVILLEPLVYTDQRGEFFESFNQQKFEKIIGRKINFVQDNQSCSSKGVLRGLHYQLKPKAQGKLVRVISGEIFDVVVDLREDSPTFGKWIGEYLSSHNKKQLWIPEGFAHGFLTITDQAEVLYKVTECYSPEMEMCIIWSDVNIGILWPKIVDNFIISNKDSLGATIRSITN